LLYADINRASPKPRSSGSLCVSTIGQTIMADLTPQRKPNRPMPATDPTEMGARVQPATVRGPLSRQVTPESTPEDITTRRPWGGWNAEDRPDTSQQKAGARRPTAAAPRRKARPAAWAPWGACEQAIAGHSVVHRRRPLHLCAPHAEAEGSSRQVHVILARGGLGHG
jgi:hypothetical protein